MDGRQCMTRQRRTLEHRPLPHFPPLSSYLHLLILASRPAKHAKYRSQRRGYIRRYISAVQLSIVISAAAMHQPGSDEYQARQTASDLQSSLQPQTLLRLSMFHLHGKPAKMKASLLLALATAALSTALPLMDEKQPSSTLAKRGFLKFEADEAAKYLGAKMNGAGANADAQLGKLSASSTSTTATATSAAATGGAPPAAAPTGPPPAAPTAPPASAPTAAAAAPGGPPPATPTDPNAPPAAPSDANAPPAPSPASGPAAAPASAPTSSP
ncbi:hypothetical protein ANO11243_090360 [Dothideomycetidae sp. 11243]|nr:hypothetical protein ANO11243_090360 [fungal sp. No.11243]